MLSTTEHEQTVDFVRALMRGARNAAGLSKRHFAKTVGVSEQTLERFSDGKLVDIVTFLRFVDYLRRQG